MEQTTVRQRLIAFIKVKGIGQQKFEKFVGISNGYLSHLKNSPSANVLNKIYKAYPDLNHDWLMTGEGEMLINITENIHQNTTTEELLKVISEKDKEIAFLRSIIAKLTSPQVELPHVTNPATDLGIKYYEQMMQEIKEVKEEIKKSM